MRQIARERAMTVSQLVPTALLRRADIAIKHQTHVMHLPNGEFLHIHTITHLLDIKPASEENASDSGGNNDSLAPSARMVIAMMAMT
jgi:hypothetical protein